MDFDLPSFEIGFDVFGSLDPFFDHNDFYDQDFCGEYFDKSIFASETNSCWWFRSEQENCVTDEFVHTGLMDFENNNNQYKQIDNFEKEKEKEKELEQVKKKESYLHKKEGTQRGYNEIFVKEEPAVIFKYTQDKLTIKNETRKKEQEQEQEQEQTQEMTKGGTNIPPETKTKTKTKIKTKIETKSEYVTKPTHKLLTNFLTGIAKSPTNFTVTIKPEPNPDFPLRKKQRAYPQPNFIVINDFDPKSKKKPKNYEYDQILKISKIRSWKEKLVLLQKTFPDLISGFSKQVYCLELGTNRPTVKINKQFFKRIREAKLQDPNNKKSKRSLLKDVQRCCVLHFNSKGYNQTSKNKFSHKWLEFDPSEYVPKPKKRRQTKKKKN
ncbi:hypothetical protein M0812_06860 [Anaeramoeba flamelloides]|uniref:Uncharacterized protein n=1 Tax=Anaeramoeba flamelloides TaxID=1746091 RepID=A0AAV8A8S0_9EUKA|nr:hypothetical protein M0812_06860 [Anaeramoeba flamelloides]